MNFKFYCALAAALVAVFSYLPYLRDIFRGRTRPHTFSWLIWIITLGTGLAGVLRGGGGWTILSMGTSILLECVVLLLSLRYGRKNITWFDTAVLLLALAAILVWRQLQNPYLAVIMVSAIDFLGYLPSYRKVYFQPQSETLSTWIGYVLAGGFGMLALRSYNFLTLTYILTVAAANLLMAILCLRRTAPRQDR
ncbi:MAG TPA: hypothetical protein VHA30_05000 [Patescibacteria group bacterium]|nr:hypothetical protein [Patescibacteria group bacterium]